MEYTEIRKYIGNEYHELRLKRESHTHVLSWSRKRTWKHVGIINVQKSIAKKSVQGPGYPCCMPNDEDSIRRSEERRQEMGF